MIIEHISIPAFIPPGLRTGKAECAVYPEANLFCFRAHFTACPV